MAPAQKKVILRTFASTLAWGYLPQGGFLRQEEIPLIAVDGRITTFEIKTIKRIAYVKDFNLDDQLDPERIGRSAFLARPRGDGLWLKLTFRDDEVLEGLANFDLSFADSLLDDQGIFLTPPDPRSNTQRLFVPRLALKSLEALGYVTAPSKRLAAKPKGRMTSDAQTKLFGE
jgi:hypothetical protein